MMDDEINNIKQIIKSGNIRLALQLSKAIGWDEINVLHYAWDDCSEGNEDRKYITLEGYKLWQGCNIKILILHTKDSEILLYFDYTKNTESSALNSAFLKLIELLNEE